MPPHWSTYKDHNSQKIVLFADENKLQKRSIFGWIIESTRYYNHLIFSLLLPSMSCSFYLLAPGFFSDYEISFLYLFLSFFSFHSLQQVIIQCILTNSFFPLIKILIYIRQPSWIQINRLLYKTTFVEPLALLLSTNLFSI